MITPEQIVENGLEGAQLEYLAAKAKGVPSPAVELSAPDEADPRALTFTAWDLPELVASLRVRGRRGVAAAKIAERPMAVGYFRGVIDTAQGICAFLLPVPDADQAASASAPTG
jgi:hypothetical protein